MRLRASLFECLTHFIRDCQGLFDTNAYGGSTQVITREPNPWMVPQQFGDGRQAAAVAEIVLREGAGPSGDVGKDGLGGDGKNG